MKRLIVFIVLAACVASVFCDETGYVDKVLIENPFYYNVNVFDFDDLNFLVGTKVVWLKNRTSKTYYVDIVVYFNDPRDPLIKREERIAAGSINSITLTGVSSLREIKKLVVLRCALTPRD